MSIGNYTRYISQPTDPFNARVQAHLDGAVEELPDTFENWPAERVKQAVEGLQRADQKQQDLLATQQNGDLFIAGHPEYIDSTANGQLMRHEMDVMFGPGLHPLEHFEAAYESLRAANFLKLNQAEVAKQKRAADKARYDAERTRPVTPDLQSLYNMPLEDLRRLDAVENQKQMQRRAEEGGW